LVGVPLTAPPSVAPGCSGCHGVHSSRSLTPSSVPRAGAPGVLAARGGFPPGEHWRASTAGRSGALPATPPAASRILVASTVKSPDSSLTIRARLAVPIPPGLAGALAPGVHQQRGCALRVPCVLRSRIQRGFTRPPEGLCRELRNNNLGPLYMVDSRLM
jgi:hypothetical protein